jgi:hypothetical protein
VPVIEELYAKLQIQEVLHRYCRGVDRCDAELIGSAYHPDAVDHHGAITATGAEIGPILAKKLAENYTATNHHVTNTLIEVAGDVAAAETYYLARHVLVRDGIETLLEGAGRYIDRFARREGQWRISARNVVTDWAHYIAFAAERPPFTSPPSLRSRDDVSYHNFRL